MAVVFEPPPPTTSKQLIVSFPAEHVIQLTLNRPEALNAMSSTLQDELGRILAWFDAEPSLWYVQDFMLACSRTEEEFGCVR